jgi:hypothetical protein
MQTNIYKLTNQAFQFREQATQRWLLWENHMVMVILVSPLLGSTSVYLMLFVIGLALLTFYPVLFIPVSRQ